MDERTRRLARVLRVRDLQHRAAAAGRQKLAAELTQARRLLDRIGQLRAAHVAAVGSSDGASLKGVAHQGARLAVAGIAAEARVLQGRDRLAAADLVAADAYRRKDAAGKLHDRATADGVRDSEVKADRAQPPRRLARPLLG